MNLTRWMAVAGMIVAISRGETARGADDYEQAPILYAEATPENPVSRLQTRLEAGEVKLEYDGGWGYLPAILRELAISKNSQMLVFSKTSVQRHVISPATPRAIYFNDETYVGYCQSGDVVEISTTDSELGTVFYTLNQNGDEKPRFVRQTDNCLICHSSANTQHVPGHVVRSLFVDGRGEPILSSGSYRIDQNSPFERRFGGWYVSGTHGDMRHLGNLIVRSKEPPEKVDRSKGQNITKLDELGTFSPEAYLSPHSDIVALLVHEHQTQAHNHLTRAEYETRMAHHYEAALNRDLGEESGHRWESAQSRIRSAGESVVRYLLFSGEAPLTAEITGTSGFREEFEQLGPRDSQGRSLRDFDLKTRMFKYPCSYLIYSRQFEDLPEEMKQYVYRRLLEVLSGNDKSPEFAHLSETDRRAILEILRETKENLPENWGPELYSEPTTAK